MAKKSSANSERRAVVEQMRKDQQRKERGRSLLILGVCVVVVVGLLSAALVPYLKDRSKRNELAASPVTDIGGSRAAAGCSPIKTASAGGNGDHVDPGTSIPYDTAPPAFGRHWGNFLQGAEIRSFFTPDDRPEVERLVHSLEHGHTILWYDDTVTPGSPAYKTIQALGAKLPVGSYFMAAPWKKTDGKAFPEGKHVALTHWTGPQKQLGVWEYCAGPSGEVTADFMKKYPASDSPEPGSA